MKYGLSNIVYPACLALALAAALASPLGTATIGVDPTPEHLAAGDGYSTLVTGFCDGVVNAQGSENSRPPGPEIRGLAPPRRVTPFFFPGILLRFPGL